MHALIKPCSSLCNMRCGYCFYHDESNCRSQKHYGLMDIETARNLIAKMLAFSDDACTFAFQGGEPTLRGLDFFKAFVETVRVLNTHNKKVSYAIQTNGLAIDAEFAKFFHDNNFLVGLSIDGTESQHDRIRVDQHGRPTLKKVLQTAATLDRFNVAYNVLCVVHAHNAKNPDRLYQFFRNNGFGYWQFIPCLAPIGGYGEKSLVHVDVPNGTDGSNATNVANATNVTNATNATNVPNGSYTLQPDKYAFFLKAIFDKWYADFKNGTYISIRMFDNIMDMLLGYPPENCAMKGRCSVNMTVEADGSIFPCDFYALDEWLLGNINADSIDGILHTVRAKQFSTRTAQTAKCADCKYFALCRGGCPRESDAGVDVIAKATEETTVETTVETTAAAIANGNNEPFYCNALMAFYDYTIDRFLKAVQTLREYNSKHGQALRY